MGYLLTYGQVLEPISVPQAKAHLRVDFTDDDAYIADLISAVRWKMERRYRRAILAQTMTLGLDSFSMPARQRDIAFPVSWWPPAGYSSPLNTIIDLRPPVQSITSVKYYDPSFVLQTLASNTYAVDLLQEPNRLFPVPGKQWPSTAPVPGAVQITHVSGHSDPSLVPENIIQAMYLAISNFYENREETVIGTRLVTLALPDGVDKLMAEYNFPLVR